MLYSFLNIFFFIFHTTLILFNISGWAFPATRKLHLLCMLLTAFSWFVLGAWYGFGYCACTDWHWQVREVLGYHDRSDSYTQFLLQKLTGADWDPGLVDRITLFIFLASLLLTVLLNLRDRRRVLRKRGP